MDRTSLGIELGSTRIKAVLIDGEYNVMAMGSHAWENSFVDGYWTYSLDEAVRGLQEAYKDLARDYTNKYGRDLVLVGSLGISGMMHGYLPFAADGTLLTPFRTWRNTTTKEAARVLSRRFNYNIPQRWSIAHLYQAILNNEDHVNKIDHITTLAGYIHSRLCGVRALGLNEASGVFPIDLETLDYNEKYIESFHELSQGTIDLRKILPKVLASGQIGGFLTEEGAKLLDPSGKLKAFVPMCPPEGDAGTGMVATNSVRKGLGNISAGTSIFAMLVLEKDLSRVYEELDLIMTPNGNLVAMVHANNCTSDIDGWISLFIEFSEKMGLNIPKDRIYESLYRVALEGDLEKNKILSLGYISGEHITRIEKGTPLFIRDPEADFSLANFMRSHLFSSVATLRIGFDIFKEEGVKIIELMGHGGFFKSSEIGQRVLAASLNCPISLMKTASEGGAYGIALLASFIGKEGSLEEYLDEVYRDLDISRIYPLQNEVDEYMVYLERYRRLIDIIREKGEELC